MTRFARAKGSKASNERAPEDGTPWEVMKEQLMKAKQEGEHAKKRQEAEQQRIQNYENFLQERKLKKKPATWCDFPEAEKLSNTVRNDNLQVTSNKKKNKKNDKNSHSANEANITHNTNVDVKLSKKKKNKQVNFQFESMTDNDIKFTDKKTNKKKKKRKLESEPPSDIVSEDLVKSNEEIDREPSTKKKKKSIRTPQVSHEEPLQGQNSTTPVAITKKKKPKHTATEQKSGNEDNLSKTHNQESVTKKQNKKNKKKNLSMQNSTDDTQTNEDSKKNLANKQNKQKAKKKKKLVDGAPVRRKEITERSFQLIINGKEIELVRFDGFPVMKRDAERLTELKNSMVKKGIPKSEVQRTMKLERRRAEKALARLKRDVCYNCRKGGHNLSDCPELKSKIPGADGADGVCFKCGSTEHRQFECKVQRDKEFRFATCFICKESGHIARQCPDNPKGLYPNGGCCKLCGDVTHLRKDCPTQNNKKEDSSVKLHTLDSTDGIEDIGQQNPSAAISLDSVKKPKKIRF